MEIFEKKTVTGKTVIKGSGSDKMQHPMAGCLILMIADRNGIIASHKWHNLIVNTGYAVTAQALAGVPGAAITKLALGTNNAAPTVNDTVIQSAYLVPFSAIEYPTPTSVRFNFEVGYDDANDMIISEFGLVTADGRLFSRLTREYIAKNEDIMMAGYWMINI